MAERRVAFDEDSAARISSVVREVERFGPDVTTGRERRGRTIPFQFRRFEMTAALSVGGSASVFMIVRNAGNTAWERKDPEVTFTVHDFLGIFSKPSTPTSQTGAVGIAIKPMDQPDWEIMSLAVATNFLRFELTSNLTAIANGSATAIVVKNIAGILDGDDEAPVIVYDGFGRYYARGGSNELRGARGYAIWVPDIEHWEIVSIERRVWAGKLDAQLDPGASATVSIWWENDTTGTMEDSGINVTAFDWVLAAGTSLATDKTVFLNYDEQFRKWWVVNGEGAFGA